MYAHTKVAIYNKKGRMCTDIQKYFYELIHWEKLHQYISEKYGWEREKMVLINWAAFGTVLKSYKP